MQNIFGKAEYEALKSSRRAWRGGGLNQPCFDAVVNKCYSQNREEGCRLRSFKCEDKGVYRVYNEVNDRSTNREERAQDAPLSSVLVEQGQRKSNIFKRFIIDKCL